MKLYFVFILMNLHFYSVKAQYVLDSIDRGLFEINYVDSLQNAMTIDTFFFPKGEVGNESYYINAPNFYFSYSGYKRPYDHVYIYNYNITPSGLNDMKQCIRASYKYGELKDFSYKLERRGFHMINNITKTEKVLPYKEFSEKNFQKIVNQFVREEKRFLRKQKSM